MSATEICRRRTLLSSNPRFTNSSSHSDYSAQDCPQELDLAAFESRRIDLLLELLAVDGESGRCRSSIAGQLQISAGGSPGRYKGAGSRYVRVIFVPLLINRLSAIRKNLRPGSSIGRGGDFAKFEHSVTVVHGLLYIHVLCPSASCHSNAAKTALASTSTVVFWDQLLNLLQRL